MQLHQFSAVFAIKEGVWHNKHMYDVPVPLSHHKQCYLICVVKGNGVSVALSFIKHCLTLFKVKRNSRRNLGLLSSVGSGWVMSEMFCL